MSSKENRKDPIWHTDGGGNDEYINGYMDWCGKCGCDTPHTKHGRCSHCIEIAERRDEFYRDTRDDWPKR